MESFIADRRYSIGKAALEGSIVAALKEWAMTHPQELVDFAREMKEERKDLAYKTGMTRGKTMIAMARIPVTLWYLLQRRICRNWMDDEWVLNTVLKHFQIGQFNRSKMVRVETQSTLRA